MIYSRQGLLQSIYDKKGGVNTPGRQTVTGVSRTVHRRDMEEQATRRSLLYRWKLTTNMDWWRNGFLHRGAMTGREDGAMRHGSGELLEDIRGLLPGHAPTETPGPDIEYRRVFITTG